MGEAGTRGNDEIGEAYSQAQSFARSLGLDLQKAGGDLQAGFGRRNPNKMRGRERRGKKGLRKKKGKRFNPYRTDNTA